MWGEHSSGRAGKVRSRVTNSAPRSPILEAVVDMFVSGPDKAIDLLPGCFPPQLTRQLFYNFYSSQGIIANQCYC